MKKIKQRLGIIGTVGVPARYGGFETLAHQLVINLNEELDITVYNSTKHYSAEERVEVWNGARIKYIPLSANGFSSIFYDILSIIHAVFFCDVLLILGVSGCLFLPFVKLFFPSKKIIVNVDGLEWRRPKWNKYAKFFLQTSEKVAAWCADEIVADNAAIRKYIYDRYGVNANLIEYGADHNSTQYLSASTIEQFPFLQNEYAFKVARIEPENNCQMILNAFANQDNLPLVFVGNWENSAYGKSLRSEYSHIPHIHMLDPIYDAQLLNEMRTNCKVYDHGHSAGGTNPSLVEAMFLGLPILSFDIIYNKITTEYRAYFFDNETQLTKMAKFADVLDLEKVSNQLSEVAERRYRWSVIADKYKAVAKGKVRKPAPVFDFELPIKLQQAI